MFFCGKPLHRRHLTLLAAVLAVASICGPLSVHAADPSKDCAQLLRAPEPASIPLRRILEPVEGLYDAALVDSAVLRAAGWSVDDSVNGGQGWGRAFARLYHHPVPGSEFIRAQGELGRSAQILPASRGGGWLLELESAYLEDETHLPDGRILKLPRWVDLPGVPPLIPGKGTPTVTYFTLRQMRQLGIPYGGLRWVQMDQIENLVTLFEVARALERLSLKPSDLARGQVAETVVDEMLRATHSFRYAETILIQSGHRIGKVSLRPGSGMVATVDEMLKQVHAGSTGGPSPLETVLAERYGLAQDAPIFFDFDVRIEVEPRTP